MIPKLTLNCHVSLIIITLYLKKIAKSLKLGPSFSLHQTQFPSKNSNIYFAGVLYFTKHVFIFSMPIEHSFPF